MSAAPRQASAVPGPDVPAATLFTEGWPDELVRASAGLARHCYIPKVLRSPSTILEDIAGMFSSFVPDDPPLLRFYIDGGQRFGLIERFVASALRSPSPLEQHIADTLGASSFCVTLNGLTKWSDSFTHRMQRQFVQEIFARTGPPYGGCDFYSFIGNYGWTPFGVHDDDDHSLLIQLGPGSKSVYLWPRAAYVVRTGGTFTTTDFAHLLPSGEHFLLEPGDLLFIPKGDFHVLETPEFSVTMGFTIFPLNTVEDLRQAITTAAAAEGTDTFFSAGDLLDRCSLTTTEVSLADLVSARRAALLSNGLVTTLPRCLRPGRRRGGEQRWRSGPFVVPSYHPIVRRSTADRITLFVRGRAVSFTAVEGAEALTAFLNSGTTFTPDDFLAATAMHWTADAAEHVFEALHALKGIVPAAIQ
jgi:Cupin superfamily protein